MYPHLLLKAAFLPPAGARVAQKATNAVAKLASLNHTRQSALAPKKEPAACFCLPGFGDGVRRCLVDVNFNNLAHQIHPPFWLWGGPCNPHSVTDSTSSQHQTTQQCLVHCTLTSATTAPTYHPCVREGRCETNLSVHITVVEL